MIRGGLFTRYYLEDGIRQTAQYASIGAPALAGFVQMARAHWRNLAAMAKVNEVETVDEFIAPTLKELGWSNLPQQKIGKDRRDIPDALLFTSDALKDQAPPLAPMQRFSLGTVVVEYESRDTKLGLGTATKETPAGQILRYLDRANAGSRDAPRWGLLTNG